MNSFNKILGYIVDNISSPLTKAIMALVLTFFSWCFPSNFQVVIHALLGLVLIDVISGICASYTMGNAIKSRLLLVKIKNLFWFLVVLITAGITEKVTNMTGNSMIHFCAFFYILHEFYSILENVAKCGVPVPTGLLRIIKGKIKDMNNIKK